MPTLFLSHASLDDALAKDLETWFCNNGFTDLFVDHSSIAGGDKWQQKLRDSAGACRVVVFLVTADWLASDQCHGEFMAAWYMGKRLIPLFVAQSAEGPAKERLDKLRAEDQGINVADCIHDGKFDFDRAPAAQELLKAGLRAAGALAQVGLDPEAFTIDQDKRPDPFPGLASFGDDDADAALFYGRSHDIAETLQDLRSIRAKGPRRPLVIVGVSGAGKSSLLKAGILPRLKREAPAWLPLHAFRPGADPLLNFARAIAQTLADFNVSEVEGEVRDHLHNAWKQIPTAISDDSLPEQALQPLIAALERWGHALRKAAGRPAASILIPIDQAEEMIRAEGAGGAVLGDCLRAAFFAPTHWQLAFTIRSDSLSEFQQHPCFQKLSADFYDLRALPTFRFDTVVEAPARRYNVDVEPKLVIELMKDAEKEEAALPLLAFTLQRLWQQYARSGRLTVGNYINVGRLDGLIGDTAERALRAIEADTPIPASEPSRRLERLGAETFVPALAQINEHGVVVRRVARRESFDEEARELLERFVRRRLVVQRVEAGATTVEVTHEALFRKWRRFETWIAPEKERLETVRTVESAARDWNRTKSRQWLIHRGGRLRAARLLSANPRYRQRFGPLEHNYLQACRRASIGRRSVLGAVLSAALLLLMLAAEVIETNQATSSFLKEARALNHLYELKPVRNALGAASRNALAALSAPTPLFLGALDAEDCRITNHPPLQAGVLPVAECELRRAGQIEPMTQAESGRFTFTSEKIEFSNGRVRRDITRLKSLLDNAVSIHVSRDAKRLLAVDADGAARLLDLDNDQSILDLAPSPYTAPPRFVGADDGRFVAPERANHRQLRLATLAWGLSRLVAVEDGALKLWNSRDGSEIVELAPAKDIHYAGFIKNETLVLLLLDAKPGAQLFNADDGRRIGDLAAVSSQLASSWATISDRFLQSIGSEPDEEAADDIAYDVSNDGSRYLIRTHGLTAVLRTSGNDLVSLVGGFQAHSPKRFVDEGGAQLGWNGDRNLTWTLSERGSRRGADLRAWLCTRPERTFSTEFVIGERETNKYLKGRPSDVCEWQGLDSLAGWRQVYTRWKYLLTGIDVETPSDVPSDVHAE
jgi:hypothetical protein